jgi:hypothetical protein
MGVYCHTERFLGAFHKVTTATTMYVEFNTTRYDVCALCIYEFSAF